MPIRPHLVLAALVLLAACTDKPIITPPVEEEPPPRIVPLGVYEITLSGLIQDGVAADIEAPESAVRSLGSVPPGLSLELMSASSFIDGVRGQGGHRYIHFMYRVRNLTGAPIKNVTYVPVQSGSTITGTPFTAIRRFNNTALPDSVARKVIPTGAAMLGPDSRMIAPYPDVLQAYEEAELATVTLPAGITSAFPYGFVVRNPNAADLRTLPAGSGPSDFDGVLTLAYRVPLQIGGNDQDAFSISFLVVAVQDTDTRMTESIEEAADTAAVRRIRTHATRIGASTVTVLNGSGRMDPAVPNYPGQRQICSLRTAGNSGSPTTLINAPGPLADFKILKPGQSMNSCAAYFLSGTAGRPATNVPFPVTVAAVDRYGNVLSIPDTVRLQMAPGSPPSTVSAPLALVGGLAAMTMTFSDYGTAHCIGRGRRLIGEPTVVPVAGVTRTWTAGAGTVNWHTGGNWQGGAVPMSLDSVLVPTTPSGGAIFPQLAANVPIMGVTVENGATINLSAFNLTAGANVTTGTSGGISSTSGRLELAGVGRTVHGVLPRMRVTGTYSLTGNVTTRTPLEVPLGRITNSSFRIQATSF
jgi:hypothetical protein